MRAAGCRVFFKPSGGVAHRLDAGGADQVVEGYTAHAVRGEHHAYAVGAEHNVRVVIFGRRQRGDLVHEGDGLRVVGELEVLGDVLVGFDPAAQVLQDRGERLAVDAAVGALLPRRSAGA